MIKNKKGIGILVGMIIVLVVIFILLIITGLLNSLSKESSKESTCKASIIKYYTGRTALSFGDAVLQCESKDIAIKKNGIYINGKKQLSYKGLSEEEIKNKTLKLISDEMAKCWELFLEGQIEYTKVIVGARILCNVCAKVTVQDAPFNEITYEELYDFMTRNEIKDKKMTYFDYLYPQISKDELDNIKDVQNSIGNKKNKDSGIKSHNDYYIVFVAAEGSVLRVIRNYISFVSIGPAYGLSNACMVLYG
jgi:competence protein ComGC